MQAIKEFSEINWSSAIPSPIHLFSVEDFGISLQEFLHQTRPIFYELPWDFYDARREQIHFLQRKLGLENEGSTWWPLFCDYFVGRAAWRCLEPLYDRLSLEDRILVDQIVPFRRRAISRYVVNQNGQAWEKKKVPVQAFTQDSAKIEEKIFDLRKLPRAFSEMKKEQPFLDSLLFGIAEIIRCFHPEVNTFDITVHHVLVETYLNQMKSNSPEGIHQDGYDYIVSALVIERDCIEGAESQIFADDKMTKILTTTLKPGQGILQPDKNTQLWHQVTPMKIKQRVKAHRSSIGFDIALIRE